MPPTTAAIPREADGHPDDKFGWVVGAGIKLNAPMIGQGDYFQAQVNYTEGALRYVFQTPQLELGQGRRKQLRLGRHQRRGVQWSWPRVPALAHQLGSS